MGGCSADVKSEVEIMWTNQHGTGPKTDDRVESQVILQYMCQDFPDYKFPDGELPDKANVFTVFAINTIRNGQTLPTQAFTNGGRENTFIRNDRALHEPSNYYQSYIRRDRNKGKSIGNQWISRKRHGICAYVLTYVIGRMVFICIIYFSRSQSNQVSLRSRS